MKTPDTATLPVSPSTLIPVKKKTAAKHPTRQPPLPTDDASSRTTDATPPTSDDNIATPNERSNTAAADTPVDTPVDNPISLAQNITDTPVESPRRVTNTIVNETLLSADDAKDAEEVSGLIIPPTTGFSVSTMGMVGAGGLALAAGGGGGGGGGNAPNPPLVSPTLAVTKVAFRNDTGISGEDLITKTAAQTVNGELSEALGSGQTLAVSVDDGQHWISVTVNLDRTWSTATEAVTLNGNGKLLVGVLGANNTLLKTIATQSYQLDTAAPTATITKVSFSDDTGVSNSDLITSKGVQTISGTLSSALNTDNGENVYISLDKGASWVKATTAANGLNWSLSNVALLTGTANPLWVKVADAAGNDGQVNIVTYTLDTQAPATTIRSISVENATLTNDAFPVTSATQKITGVLSAALQNDQGLYVSVDGQTWNRVTTDSATSTSWTYSNVNWRFGSGTIRAKVVDTAGNEAATASANYTYSGPLQVNTPFQGFVINGQCSGDFLGGAVSSVGDVNGDGLDDVIISQAVFTATRTGTAQSFVVFGKTNNTAVNISDIVLGRGGFMLNGQSNDSGTASVSGAGDVNGDGLADFIVGVAGASQPAGLTTGRSYVVFGRATTSVANFSTIVAGLGSGFVINGQNADDNSGLSVSAVGDINGDGLTDLIVGAPKADPNGNSEAGITYVVFGKTSVGAVNLSDIASGRGGFVINGSTSLAGTGTHGDWNGYSVAGVGDVNGDGIADIFVGTRWANTSATPGTEEGRGYLVYGQQGTSAVNLSDVARGVGGFVINGAFASNHAGRSVASAGDVNGDGYADMIIGAPYGNDNNGVSPGYAYVVFGKTGRTPVDLSNLGTGGFTIKGAHTSTLTGLSVASAGDVNGDGLADVLVGAPLNDVANGNTTVLDAGRAYLVYGKTGTTTVELSAVAAGVGGFAINSTLASGSFGVSVSSAGDVNGDGLSDLLVGAPATPSSAGSAYVIFGGQDASTKIEQLGTTGNDTLVGTSASETFVGNLGDDTLIGNGGADVLYAGAGNDTIVLNADNIAQLVRSGVVNGHHAMVNGGGGIDTIWLSGTGLTFDLTAIKDTAAGAPGVTNPISSIERINLSNYGSTATSNNTLKLSAQDINSMSPMNTFDINGNPRAPDNYHQIFVDGNASDKVQLSVGIFNSWVHLSALIVNNGVSYDHWINALTNTELLINHAVSTTTVL